MLLTKVKMLLVTATLFLSTFIPAVAGDLHNRVFADPAGNAATLLQESCSLDFLPPSGKQRILAARLLVDGKLYKACYAEHNGFVYIIDENQDTYGPFPLDLFKAVKDT